MEFSQNNLHGKKVNTEETKIRKSQIYRQRHTDGQRNIQTDGQRNTLMIQLCLMVEVTASN